MFKQLLGNPVIFIALIVLVVVIIGSIVTSIKHALDKASRTPLMRAVMKNDEAAVSNLIDQGANVNEKTKLGNTALILAAKNNHSSLVKLLIEKGSDINLVGSQQGNDLNTSVSATALLYAIEASNNEIIQYLLDKGADANLGCPLQHATLKRDVDTIKLLLNHQANPRDVSIIIAAKNNDFNTLKCLVEGGADVNTNVGKICSFNDNIPPLHWAIKNKNEEMLKYLIDHGADVNGSYSFQTNNPSGGKVTTTMTPLDTARSKGEMKAILIEAGAK